MSYRIALDLDSTLAATADTAFELIGTDDYGYEDIDSWDWGFETFGKAKYLSAMWHAWTLRPSDVPLMEPNVPDVVYDLHSEHTVDIVTDNPNHLGIADGKQLWLNSHSIPYDDYITAGDKHELGYDVYIDDKPALPQNVNDTNPDALVFLRDQPYNRDAPGDYTRIESLAEIDLSDGGETND